MAPVQAQKHPVTRGLQQQVTKDRNQSTETVPTGESNWEVLWRFAAKL